MSLQHDNSFESCTKCTVCTTYCPVARVNLNYPGPKQAGPDGERLRLKDASLYDEALKYCTNCKRCEIACPSDVKIGDIIQRARSKYNKKSPGIREAILSHTDIIGSLSTPLAPLVNSTISLKPVKQILDKVLHIDHRRQFPKYAFGTFRQWYRKNAQKQQQFAKQVALFHGCYVNYNNPDLGKDLIRIFNHMGIGVQLLQRERCCGVPLIANGFFKQAKKQAELNTASISQAVINQKMMVISASSTCTFTLRDEYPHILGIDNQQVKEHIELATRYLYRLFNEGYQLKLKTLPLRVAYHTPCHMDRMGWASYTISLLQRIPGLEVIVLDSQCCGISGTYGFKKENYQTSQRIGESLFNQIESLDIDMVVSDCETCKFQIEMSTTKRCEHPLTLLVQALDE